MSPDGNVTPEEENNHWRKAHLEKENMFHNNYGEQLVFQKEMLVHFAHC